MYTLPKMEAIYNLPWFYWVTIIIIILGIMCFYIGKLFNETNREKFTLICIAGLLIMLCLSFVGDIWFQLKKAESDVNKKLPVAVNEYITFVKLKANFTNLHYYYELSDDANDQELASIFNSSKADLFKLKKFQSFCPLFQRQLLAVVPKPQNITLTYRYKDKSKVFVLYKEDCKNIL